MDDTTRQIVFGLVAPVVIAAAVIAPGCRQAGEGRDPRAWRIPLALGVPVVLAFFMLYGRLAEDWQSVVYAVGAGIVAGIVMSLTPRTVWGRGLVIAGLAAAASLAIWPVFREESTWWRLMPALGTLILAAGLEPLAVRRPGASLPGAFTIAIATAAGIMLNAGFLKLTVPVGALTIALGTCTVLALIWSRLSLGDGAVAVVAPMLVVPPFVTWLYTAPYDDSLNGLSFVLPLASPLLLWIGELAIVRDRPPWLAVTIRWLLVVAACGGAVALALGLGAEAAPSDDLSELYGVLGSR